MRIPRPELLNLMNSMSSDELDQLMEQIRQRQEVYRWNTIGGINVGDNVRIAVRDGEVILTGTVNEINDTGSSTDLLISFKKS